MSLTSMKNNVSNTVQAHLSEGEAEIKDIVDIRFEESQLKSFENADLSKDSNTNLLKGSRRSIILNTIKNFPINEEETYRLKNHQESV